MSDWPSVTQKKFFGRLSVFGDSLASDYGATILDWGATHKFSELINAAPLRVGAVNGALACRPQTGAVGDGGYSWMYQQAPRQDLVFTGSLLTNAPASGATTFTVTAATGSRFAAGDTISIGGANPENRVVTSVATDTVTVPALTSAHAIGDPVYVNTPAYLPLEQLAMLVFGVNDILNLGPDAGGPTNATLAPFTHSMRAMIAWQRSSVVYGDNHASMVYGSGWAAGSGAPGNFQGGTYHSTATAGSALTFLVPGNYPGGYMNAFFVTALNGDGANWTISAAGGQFSTVTFDNRNLNYFPYNGTRAANGLASGNVKRVLLPASNGTPYKVTVTATTVTGTAYFDCIGLEATQPPYVLVTQENRPATINQTTPAYPSRFAQTLAAGTYNAGTTTWTVTDTTSWKVGDTVKIGTGSTSETRTVLTIPTGATFTTSASVNAHAAGDEVRAGFQDADITGVSASFSTGATDGGVVATSGQSLNAIIRGLVAEFDNYVGTYDKDALFNRNPALFLGSDGVHYNNQGHTELALGLYNFLNTQAAITDRLLVSASVPLKRSWIPVQAAAPALMNFQNGWANYGGAIYPPTQFYKDVETGLVVLTGAVMNSTAANALLPILTMPAGFRPLYDVVVTGESDLGPCTLMIDAQGVLTPRSNTTTTYTSFYVVYLSEA